MATKAGWSEARRVYADPERLAEIGNPRLPYYRRLWDYYSNEAFADLDRYEQYRSVNRLARSHRSIFNPANRIVKAYEGFLYGGYLTADPEGLGLDESIPLAVILGKKTPPQLRQAIGQVWEWSKWFEGMLVMVRYGTGLGNALIEIEDDIEHQKVNLKVWFPGMVKAIDLDSQRNTKGYCLEYQMTRGPKGYLVVPGAPQAVETETFIYRKEVTQEYIATYKGEKLWDYVNDVEGGPYARYDNPYGFAPATWAGHLNLGGDYCEPVIWASLAKIDQLNETASLGYDQIAKIIKSPIAKISGSASGSGGLVEASKQLLAGKKPTSDLDGDTGREKLPYVNLPAGSDLKSIPLELGPALDWMKAMLDELEADHPEMALWRHLREHSGELSGVAIERMSQDVAALVYPAMQHYDDHMKRATQMAIAIGGFRARSGAWGTKSQLTEQQQAFLPYDLDSYKDKRLDFQLIPRRLIRVSKLEEWTAKETEVRTRAGMLELGYSKEEHLREMGKSEAEIAKMKEERQADAEEQAEAQLTAFDRGLSGAPFPAAAAAKKAQEKEEEGDD
jgi:hypothetical protein